MIIQKFQTTSNKDPNAIVPSDKGILFITSIQSVRDLASRFNCLPHL
jgi:hypothetical protein